MQMRLLSYFVIIGLSVGNGLPAVESTMVTFQCGVVK